MNTQEKLQDLLKKSQNLKGLQVEIDYQIQECHRIIEENKKLSANLKLLKEIVNED